MTLEEIKTLAAKGESEVLEFKRTTGARREATETLCAMLNQRGGKVLFGVTEKGSVEGQQTGGRSVEELSAEIQRIEPPAFPSIERVGVTGDRYVVAVSLGPGKEKPYSYKGVAYRRVGNTTLAMSVHEYRKAVLESIHKERRWENEPAADWSIEDLDLQEILRTVTLAIHLGRMDDPVTREPEEILRGFRLVEDGVLLRAAAVLFGDSELVQSRMPRCKIRVARFRGIDRTEFLDNRQFHGNAFALLASAERFLIETLPIAGRIERGSFERVDKPLYPPEATREALANALCHRDYSAVSGGSIGLAVYDDRLEVTSPGGLHFGLTPEHLFEPHASRPWNPLIAHVFYLRGIIEEWGRGTIKMAEFATSAGLSHPEIQDDGDCVTVCFRHGLYTPPLPEREDISKRQQAILTLLNRAGGTLSISEIHSQMGEDIGIRSLRADMAVLKALGLVAPTGRGRFARWKLLWN